MHAIAAAVELLPAGQFMQAPPLKYLPAGQEVSIPQVVAPTIVLPGHAKQGSSLVSFLLNVPAGHLLQYLLA